MERFLFSSTAIMLALLLVSQLAMLNFKVRSLLSRVESLEGLPYQEHGWSNNELYPALIKRKKVFG